MFCFLLESLENKVCSKSSHDGNLYEIVELNNKYQDFVYYMKVSSISSGNKFIKMISSHVKISIDDFTDIKFVS